MELKPTHPARDNIAFLICEAYKELARKFAGLELRNAFRKHKRLSGFTPRDVDALFDRATDLSRVTAYLQDGERKLAGTVATTVMNNTTSLLGATLRAALDDTAPVAEPEARPFYARIQDITAGEMFYRVVAQSENRAYDAASDAAAENDMRNVEEIEIYDEDDFRAAYPAKFAELQPKLALPHGHPALVATDAEPVNP